MMASPLIRRTSGPEGNEPVENGHGLQVNSGENKSSRRLQLVDETSKQLGDTSQPQVTLCDAVPVICTMRAW